jgi:hypothetical protein
MAFLQVDYFKVNHPLRVKTVEARAEALVDKYIRH